MVDRFFRTALEWMLLNSFFRLSNHTISSPSPSLFRDTRGIPSSGVYRGDIGAWELHADCFRWELSGNNPRSLQVCVVSHPRYDKYRAQTSVNISSRKNRCRLEAQNESLLKKLENFKWFTVILVVSSLINLLSTISHSNISDHYILQNKQN